MIDNAATAAATVHGYPRQGPNRELKRATEGYWAGRIGADELLRTARELRLARWAEQSDAGLDEIAVGDFSLYDHVLDTAWMLGAIPQRHRDAVPDATTPTGRLDRYFAMARGSAAVEPFEMTKWFDTNYHYLVPELEPDTTFALDPAKVLAELEEATAAGHHARPVIIGPVTFLLLAKPAPGAPADFRPIDLLDEVLPLYAELLTRLAAAGAGWVQLDEPCLVQDQPEAILDRVASAYQRLGEVQHRPAILVASYFDRLGASLPVLAAAPIEGLAVDLTGPAAANLDDLVRIGGMPDRRLIAGVIDGRNVWSSDLSDAIATLDRLGDLVGRLDVAASCSLLHVPLDISDEPELVARYPGWFAFARQKLAELATLRRALTEGPDSVAETLRANADARSARAASPEVSVPAVRRRSAAVSEAELRRSAAYSQRRRVQQEWLRLPTLPTTTIGSFPQTTELRRARSAYRKGRLSGSDYDQVMRQEIDTVIDLQSELGLDVLVHGEPERNDMVQYFAEQLDGFVSTENGWVQSYGSRYVRPPIIVGDVSRPAPMTTEWSTYAQQRAGRPVKGMLTGPVTMLAWSFVRDDQPHAETAAQVALALRDEVSDLEQAGIGVIQVDEPALRETLPLRQAGRQQYLSWAVRSFQLSTAGVADRTQIHTHMCYAEFGDVLDSIIAMDADVISLEAARSKMAIVADLARADYPNEVGPGVWDIHSPRVPEVAEIADHLRTAVAAFGDRIWVNPDCGLKTRGYTEVRAALANLVEAAHQVRTTADHRALRS